MFLSFSRCSELLALVSLLLFNFACLKSMAAGGYILSWSNPYYQAVEPLETLTNIVANVRDITNYRLAQEMQNTFISVVSHELKTPVAIINSSFPLAIRRSRR